jgi:hypothetical protein
MPDPSFRNLPISRTRFHTRLSPMTYFPPSQTSRRAPRTWFAETTPAVLRCLDGHRVRGKLQVISLTGGLLWLSKPLGQGCQVKLMFLTRTGSVLGVAEMLSPVSWGLQPFKFLKLYDDDEIRLQEAIQSSLDRTRRSQGQIGNQRTGHQQIEKHRNW